MSNSCLVPAELFLCSAYHITTCSFSFLSYLLIPNYNIHSLINKQFERRRDKKRGCLKSRLLFRQPVEFKIKSLYCKDLILNIAYKIKEAVQKLKFLDSPFSIDKSVYHFFSTLSQMFGSPSSIEKNFAFSIFGTKLSVSPRRKSAFADVLTMRFCPFVVTT